jgi:multidrug resistance efflux pump
VLPRGTGYTGEMQLGQYNLGKVRPGQEVLVKLKSYPFEQFGTVRGQLQSISDLPQDSTYRAVICFPQGLRTSANQEIPYRNGLTASAEIITEERSLFQQFFREFVRVFRDR